MPAIVFVTAHDEYALRAFRVHAVDYLVKPADDAAVGEALRRVRERLERPPATTQQLTALIDTLADSAPTRAPRYAQRLMVRRNGRVNFVKTVDLVRIESADNYVRLVTGSGSFLLRGTMREIERSLDPGRFVRIHRRMIINRDAIKEVIAGAPGDYLVRLADGSAHRLGRRYRDNLLRHD